jgi:oxygen-independent coproporphyrinogen III oxidase
MNPSLEARLAESPYQSYVYGYPHKTAYRPLDPAIPLDELWAAERRDALFLYIHVPFCEMRCGFCNLFTAARPKGSFVAAYLDALARQCRRVRRALGDATFARLAIGGGTPTLLDEAGLEAVLDLAEGAMGADLPRIPISVEVSPETVTAGKLRLLRRRGVDRVSIGVQSFLEAEAASVSRPQRAGEVSAALDALREAGFPTLNIDLMYGLPEQTLATWTTSLEAALRWRPEELYLYPLYVRPLTTLGRHGRAWDDQRLELYRAACDLLGAAGYTQSSMRMFRAAHAPTDDGPVYCVQTDGMVGLGCGARSYTSATHYASEYAVGARGVREILEAWVSRTDEAFAVADYGVRLGGEDQRRRFAALALLAEGIDVGAYRRRFGADVMTDLPELGDLEPLGLATRRGDRVALTAAGLERSDAIGPWLCSERVRGLMQSYELR